MFVILNFNTHNSHANGLVEKLHQAYYDCLVTRIFDHKPWIEDYQNDWRNLIDRSNKSILDALEEAIDLVEAFFDKKNIPLVSPFLNTLANQKNFEQKEILPELDNVLETYSPRVRKSHKEGDIHVRIIVLTDLSIHGKEGVVIQQ
ncbi:MAG: hypothetical protein SWO11_02490 [Thermodesulfobacteriota bacterium]|nr:hypothetical protein [Thermodesulfobacteriota bacterium]